MEINNITNNKTNNKTNNITNNNIVDKKFKYIIIE